MCCWRRVLRVPWTARRSNQLILKEISLAYSLEGLNVEAEAPILWPPDAKNCLIWKDRDAGKDWMWEEKGTTEDEIAGWHHQLDGHEFEQAPGVGDEQRSLACCTPWDNKESDMTDLIYWLVDGKYLKKLFVFKIVKLWNIVYVFYCVYIYIYIYILGPWCKWQVTLYFILISMLSTYFENSQVAWSHRTTQLKKIYI